MSKSIHIPEPPMAKFLFGNTAMAWLWLLVRLYVGWGWLAAGWQKLGNPAWTGPQAGSAVAGFLHGALAKAAGQHPDVSGWYASFITHFALPHAAAFSYLVTWGEIIIGVLLIIGLFTGIAAFLGTFLNLNYLFAGTVSVNPLLLLLQLFLILAWRTAAWFGLNRYMLTELGTPWKEGKLFRK